MKVKTTHSTEVFKKSILRFIVAIQSVVVAKIFMVWQNQISVVWEWSSTKWLTYLKRNYPLIVFFSFLSFVKGRIYTLFWTLVFFNIMNKIVIAKCFLLAASYVNSLSCTNHFKRQNRDDCNRNFIVPILLSKRTPFCTRDIEIRILLFSFTFLIKKPARSIKYFFFISWTRLQSLELIH